MAIDLLTLGVLTAPAVRSVFEQIVRRRAVRFDDLVKLGGDRQSTKNALDSLKQAALVSEASSGIEDFNTYYVTAAGLEVGRKIGV